MATDTAQATAWPALLDEVRGYALCTLTPQGRIQTWPRAATLLLGHSAEEAQGLLFEDLFGPEDRAQGQPARELREAAAHGEYAADGWRLHRSGRVLPVAVVVTALRGPGGELLGYLQLLQDISARRAREQAGADALRACQVELAEAERSSQSKGEFLSTLSHELRTPLSAIVGWAHVLVRGAPDAATQQRGLEAISRNAQQQVRLIEQLLDMRRIEAGQLRLEQERVALDAVVATAVDGAQQQAKARGLVLHGPAGGAPLCVLGDAQRLQQVVAQLLDNAIKFTPRGGCVEVDLGRRGTQAVVSVSDTGQGIEPGFLAPVFDRFEQQDATITRRQGGLGIGLTLVQQLVQLQGGSVEAYSQGTGQGARFTIALPLLAGTAARPEPTPPLHQARALDGLAVLLVDDEADVRTVTAQVLVQAGARVTTAATAQEGLRLLQQQRPSVLLSDIGMPQQDGYDLIRQVRALPDQAGGATPAAALTAYTDSDDRARALDAGFQAHLAKPVRPEVLVAAVAQVAHAAPARG